MGRARASAADRHIAIRIRERRIVRGLTQREFGDLIGVTYQQAHHCEAGVNRVSAGRLYEIARALDTPLEYFFEGLEQDGRQPPPRRKRLSEVMRNLGEVEKEKYLRAVSELTRALAER